jgi:hypothetical protein
MTEFEPVYDDKFFDVAEPTSARVAPRSSATPFSGISGPLASITESTSTEDLADSQALVLAVTVRLSVLFQSGNTFVFSFLSSGS